MEDEIRTKPDVPKSDTPNPDVLGTMLSNPALIKNLMSALDNAAGEGARESEGRETLPMSAQPMGDGLSALLSNPVLLARLPQIMAAIKPMMRNVPTGGAGDAKDNKETSPPPALCREQLLLALKPFLSRERCDAVDTILRISKLGAVFQMLK